MWCITIQYNLDHHKDWHSFSSVITRLAKLILDTTNLYHYNFTCPKTNLDLPEALQEYKIEINLTMCGSCSSVPSATGGPASAPEETVVSGSTSLLPPASTPRMADTARTSAAVASPASSLEPWNKVTECKIPEEWCCVWWTLHQELS